VCSKLKSQHFQISTQFSNDWSISKEMPTDFRTSRFISPCLFDVTYLFKLEVSTSPQQHIVMIGQTVQQMASVFKINDSTATILNYTPYVFPYHPFVRSQSLNISLLLHGDDWLNSRDMARAFLNRRWRSRNLEFLIVLHFRCHK